MAFYICFCTRTNKVCFNPIKMNCTFFKKWLETQPRGLETIFLHLFNLALRSQTRKTFKIYAFIFASFF